MKAQYRTWSFWFSLALVAFNVPMALFCYRSNVLYSIWPVFFYSAVMGFIGALAHYLGEYWAKE